MKSIKKLLGVFLFVSIFMFNIAIVIAETAELSVEVSTKEEFEQYAQREPNTEGNEDDVTEIKLKHDITLEDYAGIIVEKELTIDLNGHKLDCNNALFVIMYGTNNASNKFYSNGTLTFIDSSENKTGIVDNTMTIMIDNGGKDTFGYNGTANPDDQNYKLVINGVKFRQTSIFEFREIKHSIFSLTQAESDAWHNNVKFTFEINDGIFETYNNNELSSNALFGGVFEMGDTNTNPALDVTLNFNKLKLKSKNGQLVKNYNYLNDYSINDIIPNTSAMYIGNETLNKKIKIANRTTSANDAMLTSLYANTMENYEYIEIADAKYNLTTSVNGTGGTVSSSENDILANTKKTVIFTSETGFMIDKVLVNNVETPVINNKLELTMNEDKNVVVIYKKLPFTITIKDNANATITPNGVINVSYGDNQDFVITANSGYKLVKVLVDGQEQNLINDKLTISNITKNIEVEVIVEKAAYNFLEGANQTYTITKDKELRFRIDAEYNLFNNLIYVDGKLVEKENYTSESGSTIIVLNQSYLDTLKVGKHSFKVEFTDGGIAETNFLVAVEEENPKTLDNINSTLIIGAISLIGLIGGVLYFKKQMK